jgi:hypothetical protein
MSTIDKIDNYLSNKKSSELSLVFFLVFALIGFFVYSYVYPSTDRTLKNIKKSTLEMNKKVAQEEAYYRSIAVNGDKEYYIKKLKNEILTEKDLLEKTTYANGYVDNKLKELSYLLFNDKNWANFLDSIAFVAKEHKVQIASISNTFTEPNLQKIEQVLNVNIAFSGDFKNVMKFINTLEESQLVVDVNDIKLASTNTINASINIAVWGMKY